MSISQNYSFLSKRVDKWKKSSYNPTYKTHLTNKGVTVREKGGFHWKFYKMQLIIFIDYGSLDGCADE